MLPSSRTGHKDKVHDVSAHLMAEPEKAPAADSTIDLEAFVGCDHPDLPYHSSQVISWWPLFCPPSHSTD